MLIFYGNYGLKMKKLNFIVFPYRGTHFQNKYGTAVRDLQIISLLKSHPAIERILVVERPLSVYEVILGRWVSAENHLIDLSLDLVGPLKGRTWTTGCYGNVIEKVKALTSSWENLVVLDFTPIARIDKAYEGGCFYWYDLIDNFTRHNRYSDLQKELVDQKYAEIAGSADLITGVTSASLERFADDKKIIMPNGVFPHSFHEGRDEAKYKYGFFGFVTDKFDIEFVRRVTQIDPGAGVVIFGEVLDKDVAKALKAINGVHLYGKFSRKDTAALAGLFEVGMIPYREDKSHDGSPLKLYEYMWFGKPIVTSMDYEITRDFIINYNAVDSDELLARISVVLSDIDAASRIRGELSEGLFLSWHVNRVLDTIMQAI